MSIFNIRIFPDQITIAGRTITNKQMNIAACSAGILAASVLAVKTMFSEDMQLRLLKGDATEHCYSFNEKSRYKNPDAQNKAEAVLDTIEKFRLQGFETAQDMRRRGAGFCFGIADEKVSPIAIWPRLDYHFADAAYPQTLAAMEFSRPQRDSYWQSHVRDAEDLNQYTFESALQFSRLSRAVKVAAELADMLEAQSGQGYNTKTAPLWQAYKNEHPELASSVDVFLSHYDGRVDFKTAIKAAADHYMRDANAQSKGDKAFLQRYLYHVSLLDENDHTGIYEDKNGREYAYIDADRDGEKDDIIRLNRSNHADQYYFDGSHNKPFPLRRQTELVTTTKQVPYSCGTPDSPRTCYRTETSSHIENVSERVYYKVVPAADTATINLHPQTIVTMGKLSGWRIWDETEAKAILSNTDYLQPLTPENAAIMAKIHKAIADNIPERTQGQPTPGFGLTPE